MPLLELVRRPHSTLSPTRKEKARARTRATAAATRATARGISPVIARQYPRSACRPSSVSAAMAVDTIGPSDRRRTLKLKAVRAREEKDGDRNLATWEQKATKARVGAKERAKERTEREFMD